MRPDPDHEAKTALAHKIATEVARMKGEVDRLTFALSDARMEIATLRGALEGAKAQLDFWRATAVAANGSSMPHITPSSSVIEAIDAALAKQP